MTHHSVLQFSLRYLLVATAVGGLFALAIRAYGIEAVFPYLFLVAIVGVMTVVGRWLVYGVQSAAKDDPTSPMKIETFNDNYQASVLVARMEEHGINATAVGGYVSGFQAESPGYVDVVVPQSQFEQAKALMQAWDSEGDLVV